VVSRYLLDVVNIVGLAIGALGVFYLSNGLFGATGYRILRGVLTVFLFIAVTVLVIVLIDVFFPDYQSSSHPASSGDVRFQLLIVMVAFLGLAIAAFRAGTHGEEVVPQRLRKTFLRWGLPALCVIAGGTILVSHASVVSAVADVIIAFAYLTFLMFGLTPAHKYQDRQLQIIGLILTLIGIATQFVLPVLDLLGVKIV
jgi:hypothetical protein